MSMSLKAKKKASMVLLSMVVISQSLPASAAPQEQFPSLISKNATNKAMNSDTGLVLKTARAVFKSDSHDLTQIPTTVRKSLKQIILWSKDGDEIGFAKEQVDLLENESIKAVYCIKTAKGNNRLFVGRKEFNWQGDNFDVGTVPAGLTTSDTAKLLMQDESSKSKSVPSYITKEVWQTPLLLVNSETDDQIYVDTGHPSVCMPDWNIWMLGKDGKVVNIGVIRFRPEAKNHYELTPAGPLRELARLLDKIIGVPKDSEGTYNASGRVRNTASKAWTAMLFRPWAIETPYNDRKTVDAGLEKWAKGANQYKVQLAQLKRIYPQAKNQLAAYYQKRLGKDSAQAQKLATSALDEALDRKSVV